MKAEERAREYRDARYDTPVEVSEDLEEAIALLREIPIYHHHRCKVYAVECRNEDRWRHCTCRAGEMAMKRTRYLDGEGEGRDEG